jgi:hypothetical protein
MHVKPHSGLIALIGFQFIAGVSAAEEFAHIGDDIGRSSHHVLG